MRGFAKIFEAIVASIILLASLTFFFTPNVHESGWDSSHLQVLAEDALKSAYLNGTIARYAKTDDITQLNTLFADLLPKTVDFSIELRGIPGQAVYIACVDCSQANIDDLSAILNPKDFQYKMKNTSLRVETVALSTQEIQDETHVLFFFDKSKIITYEADINGSFEEGRGIFLLSDLTQDDLAGPIGRIFNLTWGGSTGSQGRFEDMNNGVFNSTMPVHYIARYYANISTRHLSNVQTETFGAFLPTGISGQSDGRNIVETGDGRAYVRAHELSQGRAVWLQDYTRTDHQNQFTKQVDNLTKSSILWVSGERSRLDSTKKAPAPVNFKSSIFVHDGDTYIIELTIWRIFF